MNIPGTRYEGPLERKTNRWKEYHVVLNNGQLLFYKDRASDPRDGLLGTLKLSVTTFCNSSSSGVLTRGYQFSVTTPDIEAYLRANTSEQRDKWIKEIMGSVTELNDYNRRISMRAPHPEPQVYDSTLVVNLSPEHEWYWPGKSRDQAEQLLKHVDSNHFLVRDSGHEPGSYSLSVRVGTADSKVIFHYIIKRDHQENKFILVPAPDKRFDTLDQVIAYYLDLNRDVGLQPLKNPAYKPQQPAPSIYGANPVAATMVTQNPSSHTGGEHEGAGKAADGTTENEYVRLGKFAAAKQESFDVDGKAPVKPNRPTSVSRPGQSDYMNVTTQPPPQDVISGTSNGGGNYIYAKVGLPPGPGPNIVSGDSIMIRGAERTTPIVARFGDLGAPMSFTRNGSNSMFEDGYSAPASQPASAAPPDTSSCYVNCDLNNQVSSVTINDTRQSATEEQRPKSTGMSKSSAKAGKNKMAKAAGKSGPSGGAYSYKSQFPAATPPVSGPTPTGYSDPCASMTSPPKNKTAREEGELFPVAAAPLGYTDPALAMSSQPPSKPAKSHRSQDEQFTAPGPSAMQGYTDPSVAMSKPPKNRNAGRHNGNV